MSTPAPVKGYFTTEFSTMLFSQILPMAVLFGLILKSRGEVKAAQASAAVSSPALSIGGLRQSCLIGFMCCAVCGTAQAQTITAVDVSGLQGTYLLTVQGSGQVTLAPITLVRPGPTPTPVPPVVPPTPTLTPRSITIRDAALKSTADPSRNETAQDLNDLYSEIAKKIRAGQVKGQVNISQLCKMSADIVLAGKEGPWQPFRDALSSQFVTLVQDGGDDAAFATLLVEVSAGLLASISRQAVEIADRGVDIARILKIIDMIMKFLELLPSADGRSLPQ